MFYESYCLDKENNSSKETTVSQYLKRRHIKELFHFLQCIILSDEPEDPYQKLLETVEQLISYRDGKGEPPMLFSREQTKAVFASMDPLQTGTIRRDQFQLGMKAMGLSEDIPDDISPFLNMDFALETAFRRQTELVKELVTPAVFAEDKTKERKSNGRKLKRSE